MPCKGVDYSVVSAAVEACTRYGVGKGLPCGSDSKESACSAGEPASTPGSGRSPGGEHDNPLQYSCLENCMDRGAWWATAHIGS